MVQSGVLGILIACALALGGCLPVSRMQPVDWDTRIQKPPPGASLVYFVRPPVSSESDSAVVMDDDIYVGTLDERAHLAYVTKPGKHLFVVVSEAADFMEADLEPDKTYYASVRRRMGVWEERFSFIAHVDPASVDAARKLVNTTPQVRSSEAGDKWFEQNNGRVLRIKDRYLRVWETNKSKQVLTTAGGR